MSHVEQMLGELGGREAPTGASNRFRQFTVQTNRVAGNGQFALESLDQADQMRHLAFSERSTLTVADQTDTDGVLIVIVASLAHDMGTGQLMIPTVSRMDFTIGKAISIAEDEVVSQSLVAKAQMLAMDRFRCPDGSPRWWITMPVQRSRSSSTARSKTESRPSATSSSSVRLVRGKPLVGIERPSRLSRPMASVIATAKSRPRRSGSDERSPASLELSSEWVPRKLCRAANAALLQTLSIE